jgi:molybdopterin-guanine dinucleotide biosynthesis protein A
VRWVGAVLTGGASTRMGTDKALLVVDGSPMAVRVVDAMAAAGIDDVVCVGGDRAALGALGLTVIPDDHPGDGPLGGIITALRWAAKRADVVLVAPCDLLVPSAALFTATMAGLTERPVVLPVTAGSAQPLNAAYRVGALEPLVEAFASGERSVKAAITRMPSTEVTTIGAAALADADGPGDLPTEQ